MLQDRFITKSMRDMIYKYLKIFKEWLKECPKGKIIMVLDNARIHNAKLIPSFLMKLNTDLV